MPRSVFLGRVVEPGEPLWLDEDRDYALALHWLDAETCSGCGQPRSESTQKQNEEAYTVEPVKCHACATLASRSRAWLEQPGVKSDGYNFYVHKR